MSSVPSCIIPVATVNILLLFSLLRFCNDNHIIGMSDNTIWLLYLCTLTFSDQLLSGKGTLWVDSPPCRVPWVPVWPWVRVRRPAISCRWSECRRCFLSLSLLVRVRPWVRVSWVVVVYCESECRRCLLSLAQLPSQVDSRPLFGSGKRV